MIIKHHVRGTKNSFNPRCEENLTKCRIGFTKFSGKYSRDGTIVSGRASFRVGAIVVSEFMDFYSSCWNLLGRNELQFPNDFRVRSVTQKWGGGGQKIHNRWGRSLAVIYLGRGKISSCFFIFFPSVVYFCLFDCFVGYSVLCIKRSHSRRDLHISA